MSEKPSDGPICLPTRESAVRASYAARRCLGGLRRSLVDAEAASTWRRPADHVGGEERPKSPLWIKGLEARWKPPRTVFAPDRVLLHGTPW